MPNDHIIAHLITDDGGLPKETMGGVEGGEVITSPTPPALSAVA